VSAAASGGVLLYTVDVDVNRRHPDANEPRLLPATATEAAAAVLRVTGNGK